MQKDYLIHGTNSLKGALKIIKNDTLYRYDKDSLKIFLSNVCQTLSILEEDSQVLKTIANSQDIKDKRFPKESITNFIDEFLLTDKALMIASGMEKKVANYLFNDMKRLRRILYDKNISEIEHLHSRIYELRESACIEIKQPSLISSQILIKKSLHIIGGASIVTTNASATQIIGPNFSALSQMYGGYLVGKGLG